MISINSINNFYKTYGIQSAALSFYSIIFILSSLVITINFFTKTIYFTNIKNRLDMFLSSHFLPKNYQLIQDIFNNFIEQTANINTISNIILSIVSFLILITVYRQINFISHYKFKRPNIKAFIVYPITFLCGMSMMAIAIFLKTYITTISIIKPIYMIIPFMIFFIATIFIYSFFVLKKKNIMLVSLIIAILLDTLQYGLLLFLSNYLLYKNIIFSIYSILFLAFLYIFFFWIVILYGASFLFQTKK